VYVFLCVVYVPLVVEGTVPALFHNFLLIFQCMACSRSCSCSLKGAEHLVVAVICSMQFSIGALCIVLSLCFLLSVLHPTWHAQRVFLRDNERERETERKIKTQNEKIVCGGVRNLM
jgi:hypothetical protein